MKAKEQKIVTKALNYESRCPMEQYAPYKALQELEETFTFNALSRTEPVHQEIVGQLGIVKLVAIIQVALKQLALEVYEHCEKKGQPHPHMKPLAPEILTQLQQNGLPESSYVSFLRQANTFEQLEVEFKQIAGMDLIQAAALMEGNTDIPKVYNLTKQKLREVFTKRNTICHEIVRVDPLMEGIFRTGIIYTRFIISAFYAYRMSLDPWE